MKKEKRRIIKITLLLPVIIMMLMLFNGNEVQAASKKWEKAYAKFLYKNNVEEFTKVYMDKSKVPVLLVAKTNYDSIETRQEYYFYKYKKGKVKKIGSHKQTMADINVYKYKRNIIFDEYACNTISYVCRLNKGKIQKTKYYAAGRQVEPYGTDYYKGKKKISEKDYKKAVKKNRMIKFYPAINSSIDAVLLHKKS